MLSSRPVQLGMDSQLYPAKTPARMKGRVENAVPMTVHGHGKGKEAAMKTPFHAGPQQAPAGAQTQGKPIILTTRPATRPLGDKTPFPNRPRTQQFETPLQKVSKLSFLEPQTQHLQPNKTPDSQLRPSTARKHARVPRSASKSFETPLNNGNHWDVSEMSITLPEAMVQEVEPEDDYDEIEYMAPNTLDLPYQPPFDFDLPDYKEVGKTLLKLAFSCPYDDSPVAEIEVDVGDVKFLGWDMLALPELESEDPFHQVAGPGPKGAAVPPPLKSAATKPRPGTLAKPVAPASKSVPVSRPAPASRVPSSGALKSTKSIPPRPGASTSTAFSTKPLPRTNIAKSAAPSMSTTRVPLPQKPRTIDTAAGRTATALRTAKASVTATPASSIPSRPATSAATRSRVGSAAVTTASTRRPATATSLYRTTPAGTGASVPSRAGLGKGAQPAVKGRSGAAAKSGDDAARESGMVLMVGQGLELEVDDDFMFDV